MTKVKAVTVVSGDPGGVGEGEERKKSCQREAGGNRREYKKSSRSQKKLMRDWNCHSQTNDDLSLSGQGGRGARKGK